MTKDNLWIYWTLVIYLGFSFFSYFYLDLGVAKYFRIYEDTLFENTLTLLSIAGESQWFLIGGLATYVYFRKKNPLIASRGLFLFSSVAISGIISGILKAICGRFRPVKFFQENLYGFDGWHFSEYKFNSFPSGHTATGFAVGVAFAFMFPKIRAYFIAFGVFIAFTRVATTVHYVSDTLIGALIGTITTVYLYKKQIKKGNNAW